MSSEDSDQPGHPPSLIRVFAVRMKKPLVLSYRLSTQQRLLSDWADAQADLSLRWMHTHFVGFVMSRLTCFYQILEFWQFCYVILLSNQGGHLVREKSGKFVADWGWPPCLMLDLFYSMTPASPCLENLSMLRRKSLWRWHLSSLSPDCLYTKTAR